MKFLVESVFMIVCSILFKQEEVKIKDTVLGSELKDRQVDLKKKYSMLKKLIDC